MPDPVEHISETGSDDVEMSDLDILTPEDEKENKTETVEETETETETETDTETDEKETSEEEEKEESEEEEDESETEDIEDELDEDEKELDQFVRQQTPEYKDIVKKYPKFFKEFPGMRHTIFRMRAMDGIFSSVDEAKQTVAKHDDLLQLEEAVINAEPEKVIRGLKNIRPEAIDKWADHFLPALYKESRETHDRITQNLLGTALRVATQEARRTNNKNLYNSVGHISEFLFGTETPPDARVTRPSPEVERERMAFNQERQQFFESQARDFSRDVMDTGERLLRKEITRGLDPENALPAFVKKSIVDQVFSEVGAALDKDDKHNEAMNGLWQRAQNSRYDKSAKAKLVAAYLSRSKQIVGPIRRRLVKEAVGESQTGRQQRETRPYIKSKGKTRENPNWRPKSAKDVDWGRTSDLDILNGKAKPRRR